MNDDKNNSLSKEDQLKAIQWIKDKSLNKGCEICGKSNWTIPEDIVAPINMKGGSLQIGGGNSYPHFLCVCNNCGNTKFINAVVSKILNEKKGGGQNGKK